MAEAVLSSALQKLATVAVQEGVELYKVHKKIEPMKHNLEMIQAFLRDAESNQHKSESGKVWVNQVRELAYKTECAVDRFLVEIEENRERKPGFFSNLKNVMKHPMKLHTVNSEFKAIEKEMKRIYDTRTQLGITELGHASEEPAQLHLRPTKHFDIVDSEIVGFEADRCKIIGHLLDNTIAKRTVLSIVGGGGLGKTTLAQKIYKSAELSCAFSCRAWVSISQQFDANKVRREILNAVEPSMKGQNLSDDEVWEELLELLSGERYLIILDDVWTTDLWNTLQRTLPDTENASRVIISTRNLDVALAADRNTEPHKLDYLNEDESLTLLFRKALQRDIQPDKYPPSLVEVAKILVKKCGRLPLALVVLGGILSTKPDMCISWTKVNETFYWHSKQGKGCMETLRMSYLELSLKQRECFQYFAAFPEDHKIPTEHLKRLWIAEGLIPVNGKETLEDRAADYLEDLIKRSLVQVTEKSWDDSIKYCGVHDLLRDLAIHEAKKTNFFSVFSTQEDCSQLATKEMHRVALQFPSPTGYAIHATNVRSLFCFGNSVLNYHGLKQLRVLVIENVNSSQIDTNVFKGLVHMRYLGFVNCDYIERVVYNIPFDSMKNLETFYCNPLDTFSIPICSSWSLWKVSTLRHAILNSSCGVDSPLKWDSQHNLHTLEGVVVKTIPELESNLFNLRTLNIRLSHLLENPEDHWEALRVLLSQTKHLVSLSIDHVYRMSYAAMKELPCYETIQCLSLNGHWAHGFVPSTEMFPRYLTTLKLNACNFKTDPMAILEKLPYLRILQLYSIVDHKIKMTCSREGFPNLQKLTLIRSSISQLEIEEGSMPFLRQITLEDCSFSIFPMLQNVSSLQELVIYKHSAELERKLQSEDLYKIKHIPSVCISNPPRC